MFNIRDVEEFDKIFNQFTAAIKGPNCMNGQHINKVADDTTLTNLKTSN